MRNRRNARRASVTNFSNGRGNETQCPNGMQLHQGKCVPPQRGNARRGKTSYRKKPNMSKSIRRQTSCNPPLVLVGGECVPAQRMNEGRATYRKSAKAHSPNHVCIRHSMPDGTIMDGPVHGPGQSCVEWAQPGNSSSSAYRKKSGRRVGRRPNIGRKPNIRNGRRAGRFRRRR